MWLCACPENVSEQTLDRVRQLQVAQQLVRERPTTVQRCATKSSPQQHNCRASRPISHHQAGGRAGNHSPTREERHKEMWGRADRRSNSSWEHAPRVKEGTGTMTMKREGDDDAGKVEWSWMKMEIPGKSMAGQHSRNDHSALEVTAQDGPQRSRDSTTTGQNWGRAKLPVFDKTYKPLGPRS